MGAGWAGGSRISKWKAFWAKKIIKRHLRIQSSFLDSVVHPQLPTPHGGTSSFSKLSHIHLSIIKTYTHPNGYHHPLSQVGKVRPRQVNLPQQPPGSGPGTCPSTSHLTLPGPQFLHLECRELSPFHLCGTHSLQVHPGWGM